MEENRPSKIEENTQETSKMEDNKTQEKAELADDKKTEDHDHSFQETEEKTKISPEEAKEKKNISPAKMAEDQTTEIDFEYYDEIDHVFNEFLAEKSLIEETDDDQEAAIMAEEQITEIDYDELDDVFNEFFAEESFDEPGFMTWPNISIDKFFYEIGASTVLASYIEALESGNIDEFGRELDEFRDQGFAGSLVMLCVYDNHDRYTKEKLLLVLKILKVHMIKSRFSDVVDLTVKYDLEDFNLVEALQRAMWYVMCIFSLANEVDQPTKMITTAFIDPCLSEIWDREVFFSTLSSFLRSEYTTLHRAAFVVVTVFAKLSKKRNSPELSRMIHKAEIVDAVCNMDLTTLSEGDRKRATVCSVALGEMPKLAPKDKTAAGKEPVLEKQVQLLHY